MNCPAQLSSRIIFFYLEPTNSNPMSKSSTFLPVLLCLCLSHSLSAQDLALNLNGSNDVEGNASVEVVPQSGDFTVEFWAYTAALVSDGNNHMFVSEGFPGLAF